MFKVNILSVRFGVTRDWPDLVFFPNIFYDEVIFMSIANKNMTSYNHLRYCRKMDVEVRTVRG